MKLWDEIMAVQTSWHEKAENYSHIQHLAHAKARLLPSYQTHKFTPLMTLGVQLSSPYQLEFNAHILTVFLRPLLAHRAEFLVCWWLVVFVCIFANEWFGRRVEDNVSQTN